MNRISLFIALLAVSLGAGAQKLAPDASLSLFDSYTAPFGSGPACYYLNADIPQGAINALCCLERPDECAEAEALFLSGHYVAAEQAFLQISRTSRSAAAVAAARLRMAECAIGQGDIDKALRLFEAVGTGALSRDMRAELAYGKGLCMLAKTNGRGASCADAAALFEQAASYGTPLTSAANFYSGVIAYNEWDLAKAQAYFSRVDASKAPGNRRDIYLGAMATDPARALAYARSALAIADLTASERAAASLTAGQALWQQEEYDRALPYLQAHLEAAGTAAAPEAFYMLGLDAYRRGDNSAAAAYLETAALAPGETGFAASAMLGQALHNLGRNDASAAAFLKASGSDNADLARNACYNYAVVLSEGSGIPFTSTADTYEEFLRRYPSGLYSDRVRRYLAQGYLDDEDYDRALSRLESINDPTPEIEAAKRHVRYRLGLRALNTGDYAEASARLNAARSARGDRALNAEIDLARGRAALHQGNFTDARRLLEGYIASGNRANKAQAQYFLGYALLGSENFAAADRSFSQALSSGAFDGKEKADILNRRADIAYYSEDFAGASLLYGAAMEADPASGDYPAYQQSRMLGFNRNYEGQLSKIALLRRNYPLSALLPDAMLDQAAAQVALRRPDDAIATYDELIIAYPLTAQGRSAFIQKAMTLLENGRPEEAVEAYKSIIRRYPSSREAAQASDMLRAYLAEHGRGAEYLEFIRTIEGAPQVDNTDAAELAYGSARRSYALHSDTTVLVEYIRSYPDSEQAVEAGALLADADYDADRPDQALVRWQALAPRSSSPQMALRVNMGILRSARDLGLTAVSGEAARAILESSAVTPSDLAEATYARAAYIAETDTAAAIEQWLTVADRTDELYGAKSAYAAAEALFEQGNLDRAMTTARALAGSRSPHKYWIARAFILQADILTRRGQPVDAREYLNALRNNYPGSEPDIQEMISSRLDELQ